MPLHEGGCAFVTIHNRCDDAMSQLRHTCPAIDGSGGFRINDNPRVGSELRPIGSAPSIVPADGGHFALASVVTQPHSASEHPITVLVAEDEDLVRQLVSRLLGGEGYRILEARDGTEALHLAHSASPYLHLVVADLVMPGIDGWELGRRLAIHCPAVPVLYMSAFPRADIFHRGGGPPTSSVPFLEKPFSPEVFLETVRGLLTPSGSSLPL
jgi:CheY-like chemotaxis protein